MKNSASIFFSEWPSWNPKADDLWEKLIEMCENTQAIYSATMATIKDAGVSSLAHYASRTVSNYRLSQVILIFSSYSLFLQGKGYPPPTLFRTQTPFHIYYLLTFSELWWPHNPWFLRNNKDNPEQLKLYGICINPNCLPMLSFFLDNQDLQ